MARKGVVAKPPKQTASWWGVTKIRATTDAKTQRRIQTERKLIKERGMQCKEGMRESKQSQAQVIYDGT